VQLRNRKFLKFFTFSQNPSGAYNFSALPFFLLWHNNNSLQLIFVSLPAAPLTLRDFFIFIPAR
ncbi:hypothetical protein ACI28F_005486, partial [Escherichia coli]